MKIIPVILCGGSGTRLWPLSRDQFPKQFQPLLGEQSLFQQTLLRALAVEACGVPIIICNQEHRFIVAEQARLIGCSEIQILLEPQGRNTAAAVIMAGLWQQQLDETALLWVMPSDHYLENMPVTLAAINLAASQAAQGFLVTLGIVPTEPQTAYGYIECGSALNPGIFSVAAFVEKPNQTRAAAFLEAGHYLWNSGMFVFTPLALLREAELYAPEILDSCQLLLPNVRKEKDFTWLPDSFVQVPANSIDYAVMEKTSKAAVVLLACAWNDVGSWDALANTLAAQEHNNVLLGDVVINDVKNTAIYANSRLVTALGVRDHIIIETADAVLVVNKTHVQAVKQLVEQLKRENRTEVMQHKRVYRPWGWYESLAQSGSFQVKRIFVKPHACLSLQSHQHRAEHWVIVHGEAEVTRNQEVFRLSMNQSTYIPAGAKHRLANCSDLPLELIEVQSGEYLGEDDIVRFQDQYGRVEGCLV